MFNRLRLADIDPKLPSIKWNFCNPESPLSCFRLTDSPRILHGPATESVSVLNSYVRYSILPDLSRERKQPKVKV